ncbi:hypothetical protein J6590_035863 [Homalodisca vitripennis]|nr:hypothetical protein J6590_035863 [Homalodisca vitripennis]
MSGVDICTHVDERRHGEVDYLTQFLTGHGYFKSYLNRMGKTGSPTTRNTPSSAIRVGKGPAWRPQENCVISVDAVCRRCDVFSPPTSTNIRTRVPRHAGSLD